MPEEREHRIGVNEARQRLDVVLARAWPDLSRSRLRKLFDGGGVRLDGRAARPRDPAREGQLVVVHIPDPEPTTLVAEPIPLSIVFEDDDLLAVDKPAGLVVHPGAGVRRGTLVHALLHHAPSIAGVGGAGRPGIVHRLDKDTSGLLLVAKTERAYLALVAALAAHAVRRTYWALAWGEPHEESGRIDEPIGRSPRERTKMAVVRRGRPAATRWRVRERFGWASWLECELETGRTHQIRVHLAHRRHPVLADSTYGGGPTRVLNLREPVRTLARSVFGVLPRQALHAARLRFSHPTTGLPLALEAPLPADFAAALAQLRGMAGAHRAGGSPEPIEGPERRLRS
jgi:23S rRNA pseudouridine1911/1915/1917 synthase